MSVFIKGCTSRSSESLILLDIMGVWFRLSRYTTHGVKLCFGERKDKLLFYRLRTIKTLLTHGPLTKVPNKNETVFILRWMAFKSTIVFRLFTEIE